LILDGYLTNLEERKGRPARITFGDPLLSGGESAVLHHADALAGDRGEGECYLLRQPCNRSTQRAADDRAGLEPWQLSILEEFDL
jgi:hypothetical protein